MKEKLIEIFKRLFIKKESNRDVDNDKELSEEQMKDFLLNSRPIDDGECYKVDNEDK